MSDATGPGPATARLLDSFERQARWCEAPAPFCARVLRRSRGFLSSDATARQALLDAAPDPVAGAVALRWLAGLHRLALMDLLPWTTLWPGDEPAITGPADAALDDAIAQAWDRQRPLMQAALAGPPQTNEVQRSAALLPGLLVVAQALRQPLALAEIGASAGLNLWCDRYRHAPTPPADAGPAATGGAGPRLEPQAHPSGAPPAWTWGDAASPLVLQAQWTGAAPPLQAPLSIAGRAACDAAPVDLRSPGEAQRLASYVWADQRERLARLRAAIGIASANAAAEGVSVERARAADFVRAQLAAPRDGQALVLMHSVVWQYIDAAEQAHIGAQMEAAGRAATPGRPLAWLRLEPPQADQPAELRLRLWPAVEGLAAGEDRLLARCHPHGTRIDWLAASAA